MICFIFIRVFEAQSSDREFVWIFWLKWPWPSRWGIFVAIANNTLHGSKLSIFLVCQKSLGYEDIPTVNISKLNYWLVICMALNLIWTTLKMIFSILIFFACSDSRILPKYCPIITNHTSIGKLIYSAFRGCINLNLEKLTLKTGFVLQGHSWSPLSLIFPHRSRQPYYIVFSSIRPTIIV